MMDRDFKGVWIPKEIWLSKDLSVQEKMLLVEINSLSMTDNGCFASNEYFADFIGLSKERTRKLISSLVDKGYVTSSIEYKKGTREVDKRWLKATIPYGRFQPYPLVENDQDINTELLIHKKKEISKDISKESLTVFDETSFARFWKAYPKKKDRANAEKAFRKVKVPVSVLINALEKQKKSDEWQRDNGKYIPYPSTWLNGKRWEDETDGQAPQKSVNDDRRKRLE